MNNLKQILIDLWTYLKTDNNLSLYLQILTSIGVITVAYKQFKNGQSTQHLIMYNDIEKLDTEIKKYVNKIEEHNIKGNLYLAVGHLINRLEIMSHEYLTGRLNRKSFENMYFDIICEYSNHEYTKSNYLNVHNFSNLEKVNKIALAKKNKCYYVYIRLLTLNFIENHKFIVSLIVIFIFIIIYFINR